MPDSPPKRVILEKSRTVRRRYQRSNKRFQYTASQIARIEREQEREKRAQQLRERDKKRAANKKKKAEKEAQAREERRKLGLPDPNAPSVPASQPLLVSVNGSEGEGGSATEVWEGDLGGFGSDEELELALMNESWSEDEDEDKGCEAVGCDQAEKDNDRGEEEDEFPDCSIFDDEDIIKEIDAIATPQRQTEQLPLKKWSAAESFQDETALLLEEFGHECHEFDTDDEFEQALVELDAV
ncbi:hypothetical protein BO70DRAFT_392743 [Aspergillus heteromorphus CBS 117.55]|uniref:Uncharacterized protein n=1 Tax=Aspergillus heteromorphus CBS 117.55 TaxID=1448321 RepID=A0A317WYL5_9EURO|nr:uncharacterized protein BO70DRAFT_392743 [Aspergillus heteromorphus CBS 117.55]PWY91085.1 hypothetical protein BO70DRAFT_392743 [Aspergillus heteromorphus CBS 117.55]